MSKRGPKSQRKEAKKKSAKRVGGTAEQQVSQPESQAVSQPSAVQQAEQPQTSTPLAAQPVQSPDDGAVTVGDRILPRILLFSGLPVLLGLLLLPGFYYLRVVKGLEVPVWAVYIVTFLFFGAGLAGISYGIFSSSWDARREGSFLGVDEFKENVPIFMGKKGKKD